MSAKKPKVTTIQLDVETRDRLYKLKFRKTYDDFLRQLCDMYEQSQPEK